MQKTAQNETVHGMAAIAAVLGITEGAFAKRRHHGWYAGLIHKSPQSGRIWAYVKDLQKERAAEGR